MNHELITASHLARRAVIYIRQSSPHQVLTHQESLRLQYALRTRAMELGWPEHAIEVIDADLGLSAASAQCRPGFKELISQVTLAEVGIIFLLDVTRLSRNCSDWYPLLDLCGYKSCLIADRDGVGSGQKRGQRSYMACGAAGKPDFRWRGYQRMKFSMSIPFSTAQRTCSNALAPCRLHRM
jgi:hypothetical protein